MAILLVSLFVLATDLLGWRLFARHFSDKRGWYTLFKRIYTGFTLLTIAALSMGFLARFATDADFYRHFYTLFGAVCLIYLPKAGYILVLFLFPARSRSAGRKAGMAAAALLFLFVAKALWVDRTDFRTEHTEVELSRLPAAFEGYKVAVIADTHLGAWSTTKPIEKVVAAIQQEKPDLILFAGDMVVNFHEELDHYIPLFSRLHAPDGVFAVTGNHDYGRYFEWPTEALEQANFREICRKTEASGFRLLLNSHTYIVRNGDSLLLAGMENFSLPPRPAKGDLAKTFAGADTTLCTLLLSHDPVFFSMQHNDPLFPADLTLSGHTHEFQCAVRIGKFRWSPASLLSDYPSGLFREAEKSIFVTRGIGSLGFPGRFGAKPQIAILHLQSHRASNPK